MVFSTWFESFKMLTKSMGPLFSIDIVHRDLKLENILIKHYDDYNQTFDIKVRFKWIGLNIRVEFSEKYR
jgi:hypothetical protein